jgi:hypothetical protein
MTRKKKRKRKIDRDRGGKIIRKIERKREGKLRKEE